MADAMMMFLGEAHGVNWYWAQPGEFENPGAYYWDGVKNVLCVPHLAAAPEAPAQAVSEREAFEAWAHAQGYEVKSLKPDGRYWSSHTHQAWKCWQARAALAQKDKR